jgi:hypothetical protein
MIEGVILSEDGFQAERKISGCTTLRLLQLRCGRFLRRLHDAALRNDAGLFGSPTATVRQFAFR